MGTQQEEQAIQAYRELVIKIGFGFHPDTPGDGYEPPLEDPERYEEIVDGVFAIDWFDPYAAGLDIFEELRALEQGGGQT